AIQISNQQGIPVYHITSNNINSILPILQVGSDVKTDIQNSVNAGYEVIVPEREITYCGWQGVGYIIQDPTTGAGACMITGGAAGAQMLAAIGTVAYEVAKFIGTTALIVEGDTSFWDWKEAPNIILEESKHIVGGATYLLGYFPIYEEISTTKGFLAEIANPKYKLFYFMGHNSGGGLSLHGGKESVTIEQIKGSSTSFDYVHIDACKSVGVAEAFDSNASLGYSSYYASVVDFFYFDIPYLLYLCKGEGVSIKEAKDYAMSSYSLPRVLLIRKWFLEIVLKLQNDNFNPQIKNEEYEFVK
ncbi:hypothetical protein KKB44_06730, partial [Candidatus Micrarchaeota archaeon]|nr:hypothetical protein [Candidatus Micrarchaeota archaeon]